MSAPCLSRGRASLEEDRVAPRLRALPGKIKSDLVAVQLTGVCFWPFVDFISFALIPVTYIPLFVNFASFVWTIILSLKSRRIKPKAA